MFADRYSYCLVGIAGLNNGLDAVESQRLCETPHIPEMVALVLRGLAAVYGVAVAGE